MHDWLGSINQAPPLEYLCFLWVASFAGWTEHDFYNATTDFIFTAFEFLHIEQGTRKRPRYNQPITKR